jgi:hypothetical protein
VLFWQQPLGQQGWVLYLAHCPAALRAQQVGFLPSGPIGPQL